MSIKRRTFLVTGGTGSFGQAFVRQVLTLEDPKEIIVYSRGEHRQAAMKSEFNDSRLKFIIGDIRDYNALYDAAIGADIVVHAAALKMIPQGEENPEEFIKTNVLGSLNVIRACLNSGVKLAFAISTDKAAHPCNLYGATKMVMEKAWLAANGQGTRFSCSRYGNVVNSQGEVVHTFLRQAKTGRLTVTHSKMTRFWYTVEEGADFVLQCLNRMSIEASPGGIFIPKGLRPFHILDFAKAIGPSCEIVYTGIRPGEKLAEILISEDEARHAVEYEWCYKILPEPIESRIKTVEGMVYSSANECNRLTEVDIREKLHGLGLLG